MEVSNHLHASAASPPETEPAYPLNMRLNGLQNQFDILEKKRLFTLTRINPEFPGHPALGIVAIRT